jgi:replicative DNA helicase
MRDLNSEFLEKNCLGAILQHSPSMAIAANILSEKDFQIERHRVIFEAMKRLSDENTLIDIISVDTMLKIMGRTDCNYKQYLFDLAESVASSANIDYFANQIKDFSTLRELVRFGKTIQNLATEEYDSISDITKRVSDGLFEIIKQSEKTNLTHISKFFDEVLEDMKSGKKSNDIMTGFFALDHMVLGMQNKDMIVLAAPPSVGKTAFAMNVATNVALSGKTVAFFSLEMTGKDLAIRQLCSKAIINSRLFRTLSFNAVATGALQKSLNELYNKNFFIDVPGEIDIAEIRRKCQRKKCESGGLDFVVIDYLQLVKTEKAENRTIAIGEVSRKIKAMARDLDIPVLCLSQMNRSALKDNQEPELHHLRESGNIEQDADMVWFITRKNKEDTEAKFKVAKNRNGQIGKFSFEYIAENFLFRDFNSGSVDGNSEYNVLL